MDKELIPQLKQAREKIDIAIANILLSAPGPLHVWFIRSRTGTYLVTADSAERAMQMFKEVKPLRADENWVVSEIGTFEESITNIR